MNGETTGNIVAAASGILFGVLLFFTPLFLMGSHGVSFGYVIAWAMALAPGSRALFDAATEARVVRSLGRLAVHAIGLAFLFVPVFFLGRLTGHA